MSFPGPGHRRLDLAFSSKNTVGPDHVYAIPKRQVLKDSDMKQWENSEAYHEYQGFILSMNEAVRGKAIDTRLEPSNNVMSVFQMLEHFNKLIDETPPIDQPQRFGNKAFAQWLNKIGECVETELQKALPEKFHAAIPEISVYLKESFGNSTRIDYGTGHEMAFCMFLLCLFRIGAFSMDDRVAVVNRIFVRYLDLVRRLQCEYRMEPAGSHGVWSLDDYQFVPFIWGSSQLFGNKDEIEPNMFLLERTVLDHRDKYMFLACIQYIMKVKTGHFSEHSNQLWNISALPSWSKINQGLLKMYKGEVLAKFPVIQHVLFGSLIKFEPLQHDIRTPVMTARPLPPKFTSELTKPLCDGDVTSANTSSQS
ncbi:hypothetical protein M8J76_005008 [Diaphorina citri]|nr:hypothetical protein M8J76_005008 [Diaphorina citri]